MKSAKLIPLNDYVILQKEVERLHFRIEELTVLLNKAEVASNYVPLEKGVFVANNGSNRFVKVNEIIKIEAESNYSKIYLINNEVLLTSKTLKHWQQKFNAPHLIRIHQSYLINIKKIAQMEWTSSQVIMENNSVAYCSREGKKLLKSLFY